MDAAREAASSRLQEKLAARKRAAIVAAAQKKLRDNLARAGNRFSGGDSGDSASQSSPGTKPLDNSPRRSPSHSLDGASPTRRSPVHSGGGSSSTLVAAARAPLSPKESRRLSGSQQSSPRASRLRSDTADQVKRLLAVAKRLQARRESTDSTTSVDSERRSSMPGAPAADVTPPRNDTAPHSPFDERREQHYDHMDRHFSEWTSV